MKFKKQFKEAHPETIGETDSHFDKSNYIDWIDKEYTQLKADKSELLEALENTNLNTVFNIDFGGHVMAGLKIINGEIEVVGAMNGYGNGISTDEIRITKSNQ